MVFSDVAYAFPDSSSRSALAPPLRTNPPCEIVPKGDGTYDVVTNDDVIRYWDTQTQTYLEQHPQIGGYFKREWVLVSLNYLIGQALQFPISEHTLIPFIRRHIEKIKGQDELRRQGFDIDGIKAIDEEGNPAHQTKDIRAFLLPIKRGDDEKTACYLKYYLTDDKDSSFSFTVKDPATKKEKTVYAKMVYSIPGSAQDAKIPASEFKITTLSPQEAYELNRPGTPSYAPERNRKTVERIIEKAHGDICLTTTGIGIAEGDAKAKAYKIDPGTPAPQSECIAVLNDPRIAQALWEKKEVLRQYVKGVVISESRATEHSIVLLQEIFGKNVPIAKGFGKDRASLAFYYIKDGDELAFNVRKEDVDNASVVLHITKRDKPHTDASISHDKSSAANDLSMGQSAEEKRLSLVEREIDSRRERAWKFNEQRDEELERLVKPCKTVVDRMRVLMRHRGVSAEEIGDLIGVDVINSLPEALSETQLFEAAQLLKVNYYLLRDGKAATLQGKMRQGPAGRRIKELRQFFGLTQGDLAQDRRFHMGNSVYMLEKTQKSIPRFATLKKLSEFFGINHTLITMGEDLTIVEVMKREKGFGRRLRAARRYRLVEIREFEKLMRMGMAKLEKIEKGIGGVKGTVVQRACEVLKLNEEATTVLLESWKEEFSRETMTDRLKRAWLYNEEKDEELAAAVDEDMALHTRIQNIMKARGIQDADMLYERMKHIVHKEAFRKWLSGEILPEEPYLFEIAQVLKVNIFLLKYGKASTLAGRLFILKGKHLGARLRDTRAFFGLTPAELSRHAKVTKEYVHALENGSAKKAPSKAALKTFATFFGINHTLLSIGEDLPIEKMMERYEKPWERLQAAVDYRLMKYIDFAKQAGISRARLSTIYQGRAPWRAEAEKMREILGLDERAAALIFENWPEATISKGPFKYRPKSTMPENEFLQKLTRVSTPGSRIRMTRGHRRLAQEELAEKIQVSSASISMWERDVVSPQPRQWVKLAQALQIDENVLRYGNKKAPLEPFTSHLIDTLSALETELNEGKLPFVILDTIAQRAGCSLNILDRHYVWKHGPVTAVIEGLLSCSILKAVERLDQRFGRGEVRNIMLEIVASEAGHTLTSLVPYLEAHKDVKDKVDSLLIKSMLNAVKELERELQEGKIGRINQDNIIKRAGYKSRVTLNTYMEISDELVKEVEKAVSIEFRFECALERLREKRWRGELEKITNKDIAREAGLAVLTIERYRKDIERLMHKVYMEGLAKIEEESRNKIDLLVSVFKMAVRNPSSEDIRQAMAQEEEALRYFQRMRTERYVIEELSTRLARNLIPREWGDIEIVARNWAIIMSICMMPHVSDKARELIGRFASYTPPGERALKMFRDPTIGCLAQFTRTHPLGGRAPEAYLSVSSAFLKTEEKALPITPVLAEPKEERAQPKKAPKIHLPKQPIDQRPKGVKSPEGRLARRMKTIIFGVSRHITGCNIIWLEAVESGIRLIWDEYAYFKNPERAIHDLRRMFDAAKKVRHNILEKLASRMDSAEKTRLDSAEDLMKRVEGQFIISDGSDIEFAIERPTAQPTDDDEGGQPRSGKLAHGNLTILIDSANGHKEAGGQADYERTEDEKLKALMHLVSYVTGDEMCDNSQVQMIAEGLSLEQLDDFIIKLRLAAHDRRRHERDRYRAQNAYNLVVRVKLRRQPKTETPERTISQSAAVSGEAAPLPMDKVTLSSAVPSGTSDTSLNKGPYGLSPYRVFGKLHKDVPIADRIKRLLSSLTKMILLMPLQLMMGLVEKNGERSEPSQRDIRSASQLEPGSSRNEPLQQECRRLKNDLLQAKELYEKFVIAKKLADIRENNEGSFALTNILMSQRVGIDDLFAAAYGLSFDIANFDMLVQSLGSGDISQSFAAAFGVAYLDRHIPGCKYNGRTVHQLFFSRLFDSTDPLTQYAAAYGLAQIKIPERELISRFKAIFVNKGNKEEVASAAAFALLVINYAKFVKKIFTDIAPSTIAARKTALEFFGNLRQQLESLAPQLLCVVKTPDDDVNLAIAPVKESPTKLGDIPSDRMPGMKEVAREAAARLQSETIVDIPPEYGVKREAAIRKYLHEHGVTKEQTKRNVDFRGRLRLPSFYDTHPGKIIIYRDKKYGARYLMLQDAANPDNFIVYEWSGGNLILSRTGEVYTPDSLMVNAQTPNARVPVYNLSHHKEFIEFDQALNKRTEKEVVTKEKSGLAHRWIGLGQFTFRVTSDVVVESFDGMRASVARDDRERYPLVLRRVSDDSKIRISFRDPALHGEFVVDGLEKTAGGPVVLKGNYFNLSTIVEMIRRDMLPGVKASQVLLDTFDFKEKPRTPTPIRSYYIDPSDGSIVEGAMVDPRTFKPVDAEEAGTGAASGQGVSQENQPVPISPAGIAAPAAAATPSTDAVATPQAENGLAQRGPSLNVAGGVKDIGSSGNRGVGNQETGVSGMKDGIPVAHAAGAARDSGPGTGSGSNVDTVQQEGVSQRDSVKAEESIGEILARVTYKNNSITLKKLQLTQSGLILTQYCDNSCPFCFASAVLLKPGQKKDPSYVINNDTLDAFLKFHTANYSKIRTCTITGGGEPFLEFDKLLYTIKNIRVPTLVIKTNGLWGTNKDVIGEYFTKIADATEANPCLRSVYIIISSDDSQHKNTETAIQIADVYLTYKREGKLNLPGKSINLNIAYAAVDGIEKYYRKLVWLLDKDDMCVRVTVIKEQQVYAFVIDKIVESSPGVVGWLPYAAQPLGKGYRMFDKIRTGWIELYDFLAKVLKGRDIPFPFHGEPPCRDPLISLSEYRDTGLNNIGFTCHPNGCLTVGCSVSPFLTIGNIRGTQAEWVHRANNNPFLRAVKERRVKEILEMVKIIRPDLTERIPFGVDSIEVMDWLLGQGDDVARHILMYILKTDSENGKLQAGGAPEEKMGSDRFSDDFKPSLDNDIVGGIQHTNDSLMAGMTRVAEKMAEKDMPSDISPGYLVIRNVQGAPDNKAAGAAPAATESMSHGETSQNTGTLLLERCKEINKRIVESSYGRDLASESLSAKYVIKPPHSKTRPIKVFNDPQYKFRKIAYLGSDNYNDFVFVPVGDNVDIFTHGAISCSLLIMLLEDENGKLFIGLSHVHAVKTGLQISNIIKKLIKNKMKTKEVVYSTPSDRNNEREIGMLEEFLGRRPIVHLRESFAGAVVTADGWAIAGFGKYNDSSNSSRMWKVGDGSIPSATPAAGAAEPAAGAARAAQPASGPEGEQPRSGKLAHGNLIILIDKANGSGEAGGQADYERAEDEKLKALMKLVGYVTGDEMCDNSQVKMIAEGLSLKQLDEFIIKLRFAAHDRRKQEKDRCRAQNAYNLAVGVKLRRQPKTKTPERDISQSAAVSAEAVPLPMDKVTLSGADPSGTSDISSHKKEHVGPYGFSPYEVYGKLHKGASIADKIKRLFRMFLLMPLQLMMGLVEKNEKRSEPFQAAAPADAATPATRSEETEPSPLFPRKRPPDELTLREALIRNGWKVALAAKELRIGACYFRQLLKKYGITIEYLRERRARRRLGILEIFLWDVDKVAKHLRMNCCSLYLFIRERGLRVSEERRKAKEAVNEGVVSENDITRHPDALEQLYYEETEGKYNREFLINKVEEILSSGVLKKRQELIMRLRFGVFGDTFPEEILQKIRAHVETRNRIRVPKEPYALLNYRFVAEILGDMGYRHVTVTRIKQLEQKAILKLLANPSRRKMLMGLLSLTEGMLIKRQLESLNAQEPAQGPTLDPGGIQPAPGSANDLFKPGGMIEDEASLRMRMEKTAEEAAKSPASSQATPASAMETADAARAATKSGEEAAPKGSPREMPKIWTGILLSMVTSIFLGQVQNAFGLEPSMDLSATTAIATGVVLHDLTVVLCGVGIISLYIYLMHCVANMRIKSNADNAAYLATFKQNRDSKRLNKKLAGLLHNRVFDVNKKDAALLEVSRNEAFLGWGSWLCISDHLCVVIDQVSEQLIVRSRRRYSVEQAVGHVHPLIPPGSLAGILCSVVMDPNGKMALYFDEIQPSIGFRQLKWKDKKQYRAYFPAANRAIKQIMAAAQSIGIDTFYVTDPAVITKRASDHEQLTEEQLKPFYIDPFRNWQSVDFEYNGIAVPCRYLKTGDASVTPVASAKAPSAAAPAALSPAPSPNADATNRSLLLWHEIVLSGMGGFLLSLHWGCSIISGGLLTLFGVVLGIYFHEREHFNKARELLELKREPGPPVMVKMGKAGDGPESAIPASQLVPPAPAKIDLSIRKASPDEARRAEGPVGTPIFSHDRNEEKNAQLAAEAAESLSREGTSPSTPETNSLLAIGEEYENHFELHSHPHLADTSIITDNEQEKNKRRMATYQIKDILDRWEAKRKRSDASLVIYHNPAISDNIFYTVSEDKMVIAKGIDNKAVIVPDCVLCCFAIGFSGVNKEGEYIFGAMHLDYWNNKVLISRIERIRGILQRDFALQDIDIVVSYQKGNEKSIDEIVGILNENQFKARLVGKSSHKSNEVRSQPPRNVIHYCYDTGWSDMLVTAKGACVFNYNAIVRSVWGGWEVEKDGSAMQKEAWAAPKREIGDGSKGAILEHIAQSPKPESHDETGFTPSTGSPHGEKWEPINRQESQGVWDRIIELHEQNLLGSAGAESSIGAAIIEAVGMKGAEAETFAKLMLDDKEDSIKAHITDLGVLLQKGNFVKIIQLTKSLEKRFRKDRSLFNEYERKTINNVLKRLKRLRRDARRRILYDLEPTAAPVFNIGSVSQGAASLPKTEIAPNETAPSTRNAQLAAKAAENLSQNLSSEATDSIALTAKEEEGTSPSTPASSTTAFQTESGEAIARQVLDDFGGKYGKEGEVISRLERLILSGTVTSRDIYYALLHLGNGLKREIIGQKCIEKKLLSANDIEEEEKNQIKNQIIEYLDRHERWVMDVKRAIAELSIIQDMETNRGRVNEIIKLIKDETARLTAFKNENIAYIAARAEHPFDIFWDDTVGNRDRSYVVKLLAGEMLSCLSKSDFTKLKGILNEIASDINEAEEFLRICKIVKTTDMNLFKRGWSDVVSAVSAGSLSQKGALPNAAQDKGPEHPEWGPGTPHIPETGTIPRSATPPDSVQESGVSPDRMAPNAVGMKSGIPAAGVPSAEGIAAPAAAATPSTDAVATPQAENGLAQREPSLNVTTAGEVDAKVREKIEEKVGDGPESATPQQPRSGMLAPGDEVSPGDTEKVGGVTYDPDRAARARQKVDQWAAQKMREAMEKRDVPPGDTLSSAETTGTGTVPDQSVSWENQPVRISSKGIGSSGYRGIGNQETGISGMKGGIPAAGVPSAEGIAAPAAAATPSTDAVATPQAENGLAPRGPSLNVTTAGEVDAKVREKIEEELRDLRHDLGNSLLPVMFRLELLQEQNRLTPRLTRIAKLLKKINNTLEKLPTKAPNKDTLAKFLIKLKNITTRAMDELDTPKITEAFEEAHRALPDDLKAKEEQKKKFYACICDLVFVKNTMAYIFPELRAQPKAVRLNTLIDAALLLRAVISKNAIKEYEAGDIEIYANEVLLMRVLVNIVLNSYEAFSNGAYTKDAYFKARTQLSGDKRFLEISLSDNAGGMSQEQVDAFNAGMPVFSTKFGEEHGRGLTIVRKLIKELGGTISVASELDKGTTFTIRLPIAAGKRDVPPGDILSSAETTGTGVAPSQGVSGENQRVPISKTRKVNGVKSILQFEMGYLANKSDFRISIANDPVLARIQSLSKGFKTMILEVLRNSYDSVVDKWLESKENQDSLPAKVTVELFYDGDDVVIHVIDNGKPIEFDDHGNPIKRTRSGESKHFSYGQGRGISNIKQILGEHDGNIQWFPLENGTKTEIRIPREKIPGLHIGKDEFILIENMDSAHFKKSTDARGGISPNRMAPDAGTFSPEETIGTSVLPGQGASAVSIGTGVAPSQGVSGENQRVPISTLKGFELDLFDASEVLDVAGHEDRSVLEGGRGDEGVDEVGAVSPSEAGSGAGDGRGNVQNGENADKRSGNSSGETASPRLADAGLKSGPSRGIFPENTSASSDSSDSSGDAGSLGGEGSSEQPLDMLDPLFRPLQRRGDFTVHSMPPSQGKDTISAGQSQAQPGIVETIGEKRDVPQPFGSIPRQAQDVVQGKGDTLSPAETTGSAAVPGQEVIFRENQPAPDSIVDHFVQGLLSWMNTPIEERDKSLVQPVWNVDDAMLGKPNERGEVVSLTPEVAVRLDRAKHYPADIFMEAVRRQTNIMRISPEWEFIRRLRCVDRFVVSDDAENEFAGSSDIERNKIMSAYQEYARVAMPMLYEANLFSFDNGDRYGDLFSQSFFGKAAGELFYFASERCEEIVREAVRAIDRQIAIEEFATTRCAAALSRIKEGNDAGAIGLCRHTLKRAPDFSLQIAQYLADLIRSEEGSRILGSGRTVADVAHMVADSLSEYGVKAEFDAILMRVAEDVSRAKAKTAPAPGREMSHETTLDTQYSIPNTQYENDERALAEQLIGIIKLAQAKEEKRPFIVALGTSWLDDYDVRGLTHDAMNGLVIELRNFCESKGIAFLDRKDDALLGAIHEARIGKENARVVILAGQKTLPEADRDSLLSDPNTFLAAVDTGNMVSREYIRLVEMLGMAINLAFDRVIAYDSKNIDVDPKSKNFCIFIPRALPVDYKAIEPKTFYKVQTNA